MISGIRQDFQWLRAYSGFAGAPAPDLSLKKLWKNEGSEQFQHRDSWIVWISAFGLVWQITSALTRNLRVETDDP